MDLTVPPLVTATETFSRKFKAPCAPKSLAQLEVQELVRTR
jgi:hypothetical protein